jgi:hypothetical protein
MGLTALATEMNARATMLADIKMLSEAMLDDARAGQWDRLPQNESERQRMVWSFFAEPLGPFEAELHAEGLSRILEISQELTRLASEQRSALADEMDQLRRGRSAAAAYGSN